MKWHVYMLQLQNGTIYIGHSNDLNRRFSEHATVRGSKATRDSKPIQIIYSEEHPDRISAVRRERQIKKWSRAKKLALARRQLELLHRLAKSRENKHVVTPIQSSPAAEPAFGVVVYGESGPADAQIESHARTILENRSPCGTGGGLSYVTFVQSDFDRLWGGVDHGDVFGTAYAVLSFPGPSAEQFIGRNDDFTFG